MSERSVAAAASSWSRLKRVIFVALGLMLLYVLWRSERFFIDHSHPDWSYYAPVLTWIVPHGLGGLIALVAGPFQFSSRFRQRCPKVHRVTGRCYLIGVAVAVATAAYLSLTHTTLEFRVFLLTLAGAWLFTSAVAFAAVRSGNIPLHRQWMVRSYAVTTIFATSRVLTAIPGVGTEDFSVPAQWALLVATLLTAELGLAWRGIFANGRPQRA